MSIEISDRQRVFAKCDQIYERTKIVNIKPRDIREDLMSIKYNSLRTYVNQWKHKKKDELDKVISNKKNDISFQDLPNKITDDIIEKMLILAINDDEKMNWCKTAMDYLYKRDKFSKRKEMKLLKRVPLNPKNDISKNN